MLIIGSAAKASRQFNRHEVNVTEDLTQESPLPGLLGLLKLQDLQLLQSPSDVLWILLDTATIIHCEHK